MRVASASSVAARKSCSIQYGALPYRLSGSAVEILLITTRNSRRWIVPKGWPMAGVAPHVSAAREALEEAGVTGEIAREAIGSFRYFKQMKGGHVVVPCRVDVYPLKVTQERKRWPEKDSREMRWCSVDAALAQIAEPSLRKLIEKFAASLLAPA